MKFKIVFLCFILGSIIQNSYEFIIEVKQGYRKCFKAEQSPDKTLQVRFGFPRRQKQNCDVLFTVDNVKSDDYRSSIYSDMHKCHESTPGQPTVIKHTSESYSMQGFYHVCVQVIQDSNQELLLEIFIGQRLNPLLYSDGDEVLPLIQSQQLIDLDLKVQSIRKSLGWSKKMLGESRSTGDELQATLLQINEFTIKATIVQIIFLIVYAISWIIFIKQQKPN